jgi:hypothetical protein
MVSIEIRVGQLVARFTLGTEASENIDEETSLNSETALADAETVPAFGFTTDWPEEEEWRTTAPPLGA